jgi:hypothetical protein
MLAFTAETFYFYIYPYPSVPSHSTNTVSPNSTSFINMYVLKKYHPLDRLKDIVLSLNSYSINEQVMEGAL